MILRTVNFDNTSILHCKPIYLYHYLNSYYIYVHSINLVVFHHLEDPYYFHSPDFGNTTILFFSSNRIIILVYWLLCNYYLYLYEKWITWCQQRNGGTIVSGSCCGLLGHCRSGWGGQQGNDGGAISLTLLCCGCFYCRLVPPSGPKFFIGRLPPRDRLP